ncbi:MAG: YdcF family protein [Deltaproteobacteria bacterium]|nr:YdcF family protein [Deltaproteobacteria bacterium]
MVRRPTSPDVPAPSRSAAADGVDVAIVLGCLVTAAGPSATLVYRCTTAARLIHEGHARRLLLTGTPGEAAAMRQLVIEAGVDVACLIVDDGAFRTLHNLQRAKHVFGVDDVIVVSSAFHLPRVLFLARALGLKARGVAAAAPPASWKTRLREARSWAGALVDVLRL